jgi:hypothetical protein
LVDTERWDVISTTNKVQNFDEDPFEAPSKVMQTAIIPRNASDNITLFWDSEPQPRFPTPGYILILHFSELRLLSGTNAVREFTIDVNDKVWRTSPTGSTSFKPDYLFSDSYYRAAPLLAAARYTVHINATVNSTLPPLINAIEVYSVISTANAATDSSDGRCM